MPASGKVNFALVDPGGLRQVLFRRYRLQIVKPGRQFRHHCDGQDVIQRDEIPGVLAFGDRRAA